MIRCYNHIRIQQISNNRRSSLRDHSSTTHEKQLRNLVSGLRAIHFPERRDEKLRPARFTCETAVSRFRSHIFSFTRRSRVRNSAYARVTFSVYRIAQLGEINVFSLLHTIFFSTGESKNGFFCPAGDNYMHFVTRW